MDLRKRNVVGTGGDERPPPGTPENISLRLMKEEVSGQKKKKRKEKKKKKKKKRKKGFFHLHLVSWEVRGPPKRIMGTLSPAQSFRTTWRC
jgi:hypothetical protein